MNRQEAKQMLPFIQAFAEGKPIQLKDRIGNWMDVDFINVELCNPNDYRIKPKPKYRPFKNKKECWNEMQKHQPFGWVKSISHNYYSIIEITDVGCIFIDSYRLSFCDMYIYNTFVDGTPFGIVKK